jgi:hypothetical protein
VLLRIMETSTRLSATWTCASRRNAQVRLRVARPPPRASKRGAKPVRLAAALVEEVPDRDIEFVGSFDVAEVTGLRQDEEP